MTFDVLVVPLAIVAVIWTLLPLLQHDAWWIRIFEFPRVQVAVLTTVVLLVYMVTSGWRGVADAVLIAALGLCVVFQLTRIARYTPLYPHQLKSAEMPSPQDTLSLLVANVLTPNRNAAALRRIVRGCDPDIVLAVETDQWWESELAPLESDYTFAVKHPLDNLYGMHLYSRLELIDPQVLFIVEDDVPSIHTDVVLRSGHRVELHCLHPAPPSPTENPTSAERDAELLAVAKNLDASARSVVVMGDLNDVAWSATTRLFQRMSGLLDPRIGRGMFSTFNAKYPLLRWPLDHVFCSSDFTLVALRRLASFGSDHFPILAVLQHTPGADVVHDGPAAEAADRERAREKIDKVDADQEAL